MKSLIEKDKGKRKSFSHYERKRALLKSLVSNENLSRKVRWKISLKLDQLPKKSSPTQIRNRCVVTGRPRGVQSHFKVSRIVLRDLISSGVAPGIKKYSR